MRWEVLNPRSRSKKTKKERWKLFKILKAGSVLCTENNMTGAKELVSTSTVASSHASVQETVVFLLKYDNIYLSMLSNSTVQKPAI